MKMSKSSRIAVAVAFALSVGVTFAVIKLRQTSPKPLGSPLTSLPTPSQPSPPASTNKVYQDQSGFSFKYPSDLTVNDDTPDDDIHYSRLKLKSPDGTMMELTVKDTSDQLPSSPASADLKFGQMIAKQSKTSGRLVTAAIANKILYQMTSPDTGYWQKIHSQIAASFVEGVVPSESASGQSPASDTVYEAEEVVE